MIKQYEWFWTIPFVLTKNHSYLLIFSVCLLYLGCAQFLSNLKAKFYNISNILLTQKSVTISISSTSYILNLKFQNCNNMASCSCSLGTWNTYELVTMITQLLILLVLALIFFEVNEKINIWIKGLWNQVQCPKHEKSIQNCHKYEFEIGQIGILTNPANCSSKLGLIRFGVL